MPDASAAPSSVAWTTLTTASACGDLLRQRGARLRRLHALLRDDGDRSGRNVVGDARDVAVPGEADAADERGREIVGVPLERQPFGEQLVRVGIHARCDRAGNEPERHDGGARPEPALARNPVGERERAALRRGEARECANRQVRLVDRLPVGLADLQLVPEVERNRGDVEAGTEVGARGGCADVDRHAVSLCTASGSLSP